MNVFDEKNPTIFKNIKVFAKMNFFVKIKVNQIELFVVLKTKIIISKLLVGTRNLQQ